MRDILHLRKDLKERLARRDSVIGIHAKYTSPDLVELMARRCDFVFIDCENAGPDVESIPHLVRAAHAGGALALLRPWSKDAGVIRRYLGCGIDGFILPDVESADEIARMRGVMRDVLPAEADSFLVIALIETATGVENATAIMDCDHVDAIQIGTSDLAVSLGLPRRNDHAQVREIAMRLIAQAAARGRSAGCPVNAYGVEAVVAAGGNCVLIFMQDIIAAGLEATMRGWPGGSA